ncbi:serine C-palmitoyltransferase subunit [Cavenderia fasciculata]|uniref:serine C-palmitoyltransferase n=1 Tax=Cavenderia fasciculata TaxID=261658 RepID=F4PSX1_CACFS|nr:serine C-palmitoyltransferase subunit [Cavenderia fasciculata]EGG20760.1 serine C-palmitoyltransferase subunit [Cavenderia fasciculata]|eukprot:XP_004358610.1 serine C-palmitoyltransferase subunit [Cavenderia fasciculata]
MKTLYIVILLNNSLDLFLMQSILQQILENQFINELIHNYSVAHLVLHGLMLFFIIYLLSMRPFKPRPNDTLNPREEEELIKEWKPVPLAPKMSRNELRNAANPITITKSNSTNNVVSVNGKDNVLCMSRTNYLGLLSDPRLNEVAERTIRKYGVGSCGPRGFYGSIDVHLSLEKRLTQFMRAPQTIVYSSGYATITSAIPAFSKIGDIIIADAGLSHPVQVGITLSRSRVHYFKHNDVSDLARILEQIAQKEEEDLKNGKGKLVRKFVVLEGIYFNSGDIAPLPQVMALKERYKFRVMLEESHSIGVIGRTGRGICEHYGIDVNDIEVICASLGHAFAAGGGFCCGADAVVNHQRLNALGFVFSASLPPFHATTAETAVNILDQDPKLLSKLSNNCAMAYEAFNNLPGFRVIGSPISPILHLRLEKTTGTRDDDDDLLEMIVMKSLDRGLLISRSKYVDGEKYLPEPSIRLCINSTMTERDIQFTLETIKDVSLNLLQN